MSSFTNGFTRSVLRLMRIATGALIALTPLLVTPVWAAAQASVSSSQLRPFVVGTIPVVGRNGAVGGVSIDAHGLVARSDVERGAQLREVRHQALNEVDTDLWAVSSMRKVSLRRLTATIDELRRASQPAPEELQNLAGLTRVEYVLLYPEHGDIVLAGPAEGWKVDADGNAVGQVSGHSILQLDDLVVALRTAKGAAAGERITCSIDPTAEGLARLQRALAARNVRLDKATLARFERSLGPQQITVTGVPASSHFANVLVAADFMMKRLAMGFEPAPVRGLPSYLEMLKTSPGRAPYSDAPRFWLAPRYEALLKDADGLAWQWRGAGVQAHTEEGYLAAGGAVVGGSPNPLAQEWADTMTAKYEALTSAMPIFASLRNCMDLAVAAAILEREDAPARTGCDLSLLMDERNVAIAEYRVPKSVESQASLVTKGRQNIVSVSGGVDIDAWSILDRFKVHGDLKEVRHHAAPQAANRWWWD